MFLLINNFCIFPVILICYLNYKCINQNIIYFQINLYSKIYLNKCNKYFVYFNNIWNIYIIKYEIYF